ncbi:hypothetical protein BS618_07655 [Rhodococcus erythropolis]|uniref:YopX family protein n=1 Tax=Rhodococcus qingshengii TaxID=334542 RepID=UPI000935BF31|nr:YopX family protein [Rhodococcus qingshengii]MCZ4544954.1 YopX family protein [Rhodococcus qingshengii]OKA15801.1 hypothetical protein BS618_07655 [Rhodococcus erythropolis]
MSRVIKLGAWDGVGMHDWDWFKLQRHATDWLDQNATENWHVMQFTGLLDKRRAEIYEGDILDGFCSQGRVLLGAVEWQQNKLRFYAPPRRSRSDADLFERMTSFEVVGNVYEHPHLLEESS